ncbi:MAG: L-seryl-tRNA(Sec) selenium transferase, partial [Trichlorobacter sp.]
MTTQPQDRRRSLPQLDRLLRWPELTDLRESVGEQLLKEAGRTVLSSLRDALRQNSAPDLSTAAISHQVRQAVTQQLRPHLQTVINGSGVVVHTNLGRSPLADAALSQMHEIAKRYSNLEYDLEKGERGERYVHVESLLTELTGTEAALVVNNNAAAVLLTLSALAQGGEAIVSRGELVEIGGSFRIPDVMRHSGVTLVEVGTTNRTHPADYHQAIN